VSKVVIQPPDTSQSGNPVQYAPGLPSGSGSGGNGTGSNGVTSGVARTHAYTDTGCEVSATTPNVYTIAYTVAQNVCNQPGVTDQETWGSLNRWQDNTWEAMADCYTNAPTDGWQSCTSSFDCYHPTVAYRYIGYANAYAVEFGVGYFGSAQSATEYSDCY
jgi:hypothetical protein